MIGMWPVDNYVIWYQWEYQNKTSCFGSLYIEVLQNIFFKIYFLYNDEDKNLHVFNKIKCNTM